MSEIVADAPNPQEGSVEAVPAEFGGGAGIDLPDPIVVPDPEPSAPGPWEAPPPVYVPPPVTVLADPAVSLDEFMQNLSRSDSRVSLVNAFAVMVSANGMTRATPAEFNAAYVAFCNAPA